MDKQSKKSLMNFSKRVEEKQAKTFDDIPRYGHFRRKLGVAKIFRQDEFPDLPPSLSNLPSFKLSDLFVEYTSWLSYVSQRMYEHTWELRKSKAEYQTVKANKLFVASGRYKDKEKASVMRDPEIVELRKKLLEREAYVSCLKGLLWRIKNYLYAIRFEKDRRVNERYTEGS